MKQILAADQTRCTVMHFLRSVNAGKINEAWFDGLKANTPNHSPELKKQFDTLATLMEDLKDGDKLVFTYRPGIGTEVKVKGQNQGDTGRQGFCRCTFFLLDRQETRARRRI